jgi:hypothetical protein
MHKIKDYQLEKSCKIFIQNQGNGENTIKDITKLIIYEPTLAHLNNIKYDFLGHVKDTKQETLFNKVKVDFNNTIRAGAISPEQIKIFMQFTDYISDNIKIKHSIADAEHSVACLSLLTTEAKINADNGTEESRTLIFSPETASWLTGEDLRNLSALDRANLIKIIDNFFFNLAELIG